MRHLGWIDEPFPLVPECSMHVLVPLGDNEFRCSTCGWWGLEDPTDAPLELDPMRYEPHEYQPHHPGIHCRCGEPPEATAHVAWLERRTSPSHDTDRSDHA